MEYQEIVDQIKNNPILLIGIGKELQIKPELFGEKEISVSYAEKMIRLNQQEIGEPLKIYRDAYISLRELIEGKDYFLVTTNVDGMLEHTGFDKKRIVAPCGSIYYMQCEDSSHGIWNIKEDILQGKELCCPICGKQGILNIVDNKPYNEMGYLKQWEAYTNWLKKTINKDLFILELGEGFENPTVIRWPFEKIAFLNQKSKFARVNQRFPQMGIKERTYSIKEDSISFLNKIGKE